MIHYDEALDNYTLTVQGAKITFPNMASMIDFAWEKYKINLLIFLN